jgi:hypothetical protein
VSCLCFYRDSPTGVSVVALGCTGGESVKYNGATGEMISTLKGEEGDLQAIAHMCHFDSPLGAFNHRLGRKVLRMCAYCYNHPCCMH